MDITAYFSGDIYSGYIQYYTTSFNHLGFLLSVGWLSSPLRLAPDAMTARRREEGRACYRLGAIP